MVPRLSNTPAVTVTDGQADISPLMQADTSTKLVLEVIGLMCDGQHRSMQDYLRVQPDNFKASHCTIHLQPIGLLAMPKQ